MYTYYIISCKLKQTWTKYQKMSKITKEINSILGPKENPNYLLLRTAIAYYRLGDCKNADLIVSNFTNDLYKNNHTNFYINKYVNINILQLLAILPLNSIFRYIKKIKKSELDIMMLSNLNVEFSIGESAEVDCFFKLSDKISTKKMFLKYSNNEKIFSYLLKKSVLNLTNDDLNTNIENIILSNKIWLVKIIKKLYPNYLSKYLDSNNSNLLIYVRTIEMLDFLISAKVELSQKNCNGNIPFLELLNVDINLGHKSDIKACFIEHFAKVTKKSSGELEICNKDGEIILWDYIFKKPILYNYLSLYMNVSIKNNKNDYLLDYFFIKLKRYAPQNKEMLCVIDKLLKSKEYDVYNDNSSGRSVIKQLKFFTNLKTEKINENLENFKLIAAKYFLEYSLKESYDDIAKNVQKV